MTEIFIKKEENKKEIALVENGNLVEYYEENNDTLRREGRKYIFRNCKRYNTWYAISICRYRNRKK